MTFEKFWKTAPENGSSWEEFYGKDSWEYPEAENLARKAFEAGQRSAAQEILLICMGNLHDCYGIDVAHEIRERFLAS